MIIGTGYGGLKVPKETEDYETFAQQMMHSYLISYLNLSTNRQGILLHYILPEERQDVSSVYTDYLFLQALRDIINYEKQQLESKQKEKQNEPSSMQNPYFHQRCAFRQFRTFRQLRRMPKPASAIVPLHNRYHHMRKIPRHA